MKKPTEGSKGKQQQPRGISNSKPRVDVHVAESGPKVLQATVKDTYATAVQAEVMDVVVNNYQAAANMKNCPKLKVHEEETVKLG